ADSLLALAEQEDPAWVEPVLQRGWVAYAVSRLGGVERSHNEQWIARGLEHAERALASHPNNADALELSATLPYRRYLLNLARPPHCRTARCEMSAQPSLAPAPPAPPRRTRSVTR